jgi:hypothetical protein
MADGHIDIASIEETHFTRGKRIDAPTVFVNTRPLNLVFETMVYRAQ